jgi:hypothetical protein
MPALALPLAGEDPSLSSRSISSISANRRYACSAVIRCAWRSLIVSVDSGTSVDASVLPAARSARFGGIAGDSLAPRINRGFLI